MNVYLITQLFFFYRLDLPSPSSFEHLPDIVSQTNFTTDNYTLPITTTNHHESRTSIDVIREMTCSSPLRQEYASLTVLDVYDEAALIGKDFERIIEGICFWSINQCVVLYCIAYGTETIRDLVPKVIRILELLELQAAKNEKETDELMEMKTRIERLEAEKSETRELREKFDGELELIEEQWRKEVSIKKSVLFLVHCGRFF
jgi:cell division protein FtsB